MKAHSIGKLSRAVVSFIAILGLIIGEHVLSPQSPTGLLPPHGSMLQGFVRGLVFTPIAVGIVLIYRSSRAINFAQAAIGLVPATLAALLVLNWGWNYWFSAVVGLVASVLLGVIVEFALIRRFFAAPRLILTVVTIGVAQILFFLNIELNTAFGTSGDELKPPINLDFKFAGVAFTGHDVMPMLVVPVVLAALAVFLRRSSFGQGVRAAAERSDRASLLGIPVRRLQMMVWAIATALSFVSMLLYAGRYQLPRAVPLGAESLLIALAAAHISRYEHLPTVVTTTIGLSMFNDAMLQEWPHPVHRDFGLSLIVIAAMYSVREPNTARVAAGSVSSWQSTREVRAIPHELARLPQVRGARLGLLGLLAAFVSTLPLWLPPSKMFLATTVGIFALVGVSLVILTGWAGQVSLGHMAVASVASTAAAIATTRYGSDMILALLIAAGVGALFLVLIGLPALKSSGLSLGITTLAATLTVGYLINPAWAPWFYKKYLPDFGFNARRPTLAGIDVLNNESHYFFFVLGVLARLHGERPAPHPSRTGLNRIARKRSSGKGIRHRTNHVEDHGVSLFWRLRWGGRGAARVLE